MYTSPATTGGTVLDGDGNAIPDGLFSFVNFNTTMGKCYFVVLGNYNLGGAAFKLNIY